MDSINTVSIVGSISVVVVLRFAFAVLLFVAVIVVVEIHMPGGLFLTIAIEELIHPFVIPYILVIHIRP
jgi:hypothetical protein